LDQEEQQQDIEEAKASFGVDAEVPEPTTKETDAPGGEKDQGEKTDAKVKSPTSVPKTKVALMASIQSAMATYDKKKLEGLYASMHGMKEEVEETTATSIKEIKQISAEDVNVAEDVEAMFAGQDLSEDFTSKATTIFEAAVVSKVNQILESAIVLRDVTEGLTESQVVKMKSLAEGVEFESAEDYEKKLETIKENYFPQEEVISEDTSFDSEPVELEEETEVQVDPEMKAYMDAISRSIKK
jgi:hypothetical protein